MWLLAIWARPSESIVDTRYCEHFKTLDHAEERDRHRDNWVSDEVRWRGLAMMPDDVWSGMPLGRLDNTWAMEGADTGDGSREGVLGRYL